MNIWDKYPTKGTHFEAMQDKVKQHTWEYYVYYGRDRDDWSKHTLQAPTLERAQWKANAEWAFTGYTVWNKTFKLTDNQ